MDAKRRTIAICLLAVSLLISGFRPGQLLVPTGDSKVYANRAEAVSHDSSSNTRYPLH
jgi:hypothetical protein